MFICTEWRNLKQMNYTHHLWTLSVVFSPRLCVKHLPELRLHLYSHFTLVGGGCFPLPKQSFSCQTFGRGSAVGVRVAVWCAMDGHGGSSDGWQRQPHSCWLSWLLCGASTRALAPAENRSSSPSFCYLQMNMALVDPNLNLGAERGVSWGGRHPALIPHSKHGQLQSGIRPLLTTLPSQVVNFSQGWRSCSSGMEILLFFWASGPALDHPHS